MHILTHAQRADLQDFLEFDMIKKLIEKGEEMDITVICVGKVKESYLRDGIDDFVKQIKKYATIKIVELIDEKTKDGASDIEDERIRQIEGGRILNQIGERDYVWALCIEGKQLSTSNFVNQMVRTIELGRTTQSFIIGGSLGLDKRVTNRADYKLSFGHMTFPHQMMKMILLEQISRTLPQIGQYRTS